jgi:hypothetical protein
LVGKIAGAEDSRAPVQTGCEEPDEFLRQFQVTSSHGVGKRAAESAA